ncbi:MAG: hypothetical protein AAF518_00120 [Spirochaetota bacterium]
MIQFQYKKDKDDSFIITLKTEVTEIGTFHRMASVIFELGWDIISGEINTIMENEKEYSYNVLRIQLPGSDNARNAMEIGIMLDSIFSGSPEKPPLPQKSVSKKPIFFFREQPELIFQDDMSKDCTVFYIEADSGRGLLYHLSAVLLKYEINIIRAYIETDAVTSRAKDTFYLQDRQGKMFGKQEIVKTIRKEILENLTTNSKSS